MNFERAEVVLLPESVLKDVEREVLAPRAKVVSGLPEDMDADQIVAFVDALAVLRWGPKIQEQKDEG